MTPRTAQLFGAFLALLGVVLGAFGAHSLHLDGKSLDIWHTASSYQWFHALALLALAGHVRRGPAVCWLLGVLFFSGSLYVLTADPSSRHWIWPVTPFGGVLLIVGWIWFIVNLLRPKN